MALTAGLRSTIAPSSSRCTKRRAYALPERAGSSTIPPFSCTPRLMNTTPEVVCPGCGLRMPENPGATGHAYYNASRECWAVYSEVLGAEYSHAVIFGQVHQLTVDAYAVQHAGGEHPDKSVGIHLAGLHLTLVRSIRPPLVPPYLQQLAESVETWPHFEPTKTAWRFTVFDVALVAGELEDHTRVVREWSAEVWEAWSPYHDAIAALVEQHLGADLSRS